MLAALGLGAIVPLSGESKPRLLVELPAYAVTPDGMMASAVYRFPAGGRDIQVSNRPAS